MGDQSLPLPEGLFCWNPHNGCVCGVLLQSVGEKGQLWEIEIGDKINFREKDKRSNSFGEIMGERDGLLKVIGFLRYTKAMQLMHGHGGPGAVRRDAGCPRALDPTVFGRERRQPEGQLQMLCSFFTREVAAI